MAKHTKALSGPAKRKYFRDVLAAEPGVTAEAAARLTAKFDADLTHMRVRSHVSLPLITPKVAVPARAATAQAASVPIAPSQQPQAAPDKTIEQAFDPHAFSLIVVMTRQGADGLRKTLETIDDPDHLRALARAQHVAIDTTLAAPDDLRSAIIAGTAQRIADRRAAAS